MTTRTLTQNRSLHKYCELVALALNDAGLDMQTVLAEGTSIPWSEYNIKEQIWRTVQLASTGKFSTTELTTTEVSSVYEIIHRHLAESFGVTVHWPEREWDAD